MAVTDAAVFAWGSNACGQLGSRTFRDKGMPTEVRDLAGKHVGQVACGDAHTLFLCRCVRARARVRVCVCVRACARACVRACMCHWQARQKWMS